VHQGRHRNPKPLWNLVSFLVYGFIRPSRAEPLQGNNSLPAAYCLRIIQPLCKLKMLFHPPLFARKLN
jgi:hypothetical protein